MASRPMNHMIAVYEKLSMSCPMAQSQAQSEVGTQGVVGKVGGVAVPGSSAVGREVGRKWQKPDSYLSRSKREFLVGRVGRGSGGKEVGEVYGTILKVL